MFYRSFFYECLVNLYFKKKINLEGFGELKYPIENRYIKLVITTT